MDDSSMLLNDTELFISLLSRSEHALSVYVLALVGHPQDADDILQQGKLVMWRSFSSFQRGTNFHAWARKVLFHQILAYRKRKKRDRLVLSDELLAIANEAIEQHPLIESAPASLLAGCLERLTPENKQILQKRYYEEMTVEAISDQSGRTVEAVYRLLSRLRSRLAECLQLAIKRQEHPEVSL